jgi:two-component system chemotaxis response regulator CheY
MEGSLVLPMPHPLAESSSPATWPLNILYADDMPELRLLMRDRLALDGHRVEPAADGEEALVRLAGAPGDFNLVITDHQMPRIDGLDLVGHIRRLPFTGKIIILSSQLSPALSQSYRRFGVDLILTKPIFPPSFCEVLRLLFAPKPPGSNQPERAAQPADAWAEPMPSDFSSLNRPVPG